MIVKVNNTDQQILNTEGITNINFSIQHSYQYSTHLASEAWHETEPRTGLNSLKIKIHGLITNLDSDSLLLYCSLNNIAALSQIQIRHSYDIRAICIIESYDRAFDRNKIHEFKMSLISTCKPEFIKN